MDKTLNLKTTESVLKSLSTEEKEANKIMIKRGFQNPKNQKAAQKHADKKERKTGKPLTQKDIKILKLKATSKKR